MKAVVCRGGALLCEEIAEPAPAEGHALVKTLACGICGSDLHTVHMMAEYGAPGGFVLGHEYCAEVLESRRFKPGTRVVAMPYIKGNGGTELIGFSPNFPGGFAERMVLTEKLLLEVPNGLPTDLAALTEPMAVGAHGVARANIDEDCVALIIGMGPVGAAVLANLKACGFGPVIAAEFSAARRSLAERLGADVVVDPAAESPYSRWAEFGVPIDHDPLAALLGRHRQMRAVIFECVGNPGLLQEIVTGAPHGSDVVLLGVCLKPDTFVPAAAVQKQLTIRTGVFYSAEEFERSLRNLAEGLIDGSALVTDRVGLSGVAAAFESLAKPQDQIKILVEPTRV